VRTDFESYWDELERPKKQLPKVVETRSGEVRRTQSEIDIFDARMVLKSLGMILGVNIFVSGVLVGLAFLLQRLFVAFLILGLSVAIGRGQELVADPLLAATVRLYGEPVISANPYLLNSTSNPYGPWGAKEFLYSFNNDVGPLGAPEFLDSVNNEYGTGLKVELVAPVLDLEAP
jgi:hypothetical protein